MVANRRQSGGGEARTTKQIVVAELEESEEEMQSLRGSGSRGRSSSETAMTPRSAA